MLPDSKTPIRERLENGEKELAAREPVASGLLLKNPRAKGREQSIFGKRGWSSMPRHQALSCPAIPPSSRPTPGYRDLTPEVLVPGDLALPVEFPQLVEV